MAPAGYILTRMNRLFRLAVKATSALLIAAAVLAPAVVWAQEQVPQPTLRRSSPSWLGFLIMFLLLAMVMAVSLMPSKRGHQD